jgi:diguanylate cyclase (GGDEF)-like protein
MVAELPERWQHGLSAVLAAETEQMALEAAVGAIARIMNAPTVGILKGRSEHLSSVAALEQDQYIAPLFVEALRMVDPRLLGDSQRHLALLGDRAVLRLVFHDEDQILGAICTLDAERSDNPVADAPYFAILELALVQTVQRLRRLSETRLLYEISLRLSSTLDLPQLLQEVLALTATTFAATSSRVFLYDERVGDLVMSFGPMTKPGLPTTIRVPMEGTIAGQVVRDGEAFIRNQQGADGLIITEAESSLAMGKLICVPLIHSNRTLGALMLINQLDGPDFLEEDLRLLSTVGSTIAVMIANARLYQRAIRDALTGAYNRGAFDNTLQEYWNRWQESGEGFALILMDLDNFKQINDRLGHTTGDQVLQQVTKILWETLREDDNIFRYGGEEFGVLIRGLTDLSVVGAIAERLRAALDRELTINSLVRVNISASIGLVIHPNHGASSPRDLLDMADDAAYQAKRSGKNRVVAAPLPSLAA